MFGKRYLIWHAEANRRQEYNGNARNPMQVGDENMKADEPHHMHFNFSITVGF